ncbi:MAG: TatD family hydrolase [Candidatus Enteromonas sp.]
MYYDSHLHLNDEAFAETLEQTILEAKKEGVSLFLCAGYDLASSKRAVEIASRYPEVYALVGFHPENLEGVSEDALKEMEELSKSPKVLGIGEIGLDYHWYKDPKDHENQKKWFVKQIDLANRLNLPICIHAREAYGDLLPLLKEHPVHRSGVLHCYSGSVEMMKEFAKLGFYFGFDGPITYKNAVTPKECVKACPIDRILVETDSPYLPPVPHRGKQNKPAFIPIIVRQMASLREIDENSMKEALEQNFMRLFHVKHGQD